MAFVEVRDLAKVYHRRDSSVRAVDGVSLDINRGESLGVIGESGSGKSTLTRLVLRLIDADSGSVVIDGTDIGTLRKTELRRRRRDWQIVFQEPYASLNPRLSIHQIVAEPLVVGAERLTAAQRRDRVVAILDEVGLASEFLDRRPINLSGGQQQRVGIARALITEPSFVVLDEPTASLDVTIRSSILVMLARLRRERGLTYLLISHDITSVESMCSHIAVMRGGQFVESGSMSDVSERPQHEYTRSLLSARLTVDAGLEQRSLARSGSDLSEECEK